MRTVTGTRLIRFSSLPLTVYLWEFYTEYFFSLFLSLNIPRNYDAIRKNINTLITVDRYITNSFANEIHTIRRNNRRRVTLRR